MQTTIKNFVHTKDYTTFLIHNTAVWTSLKTKFTEDLGQYPEGKVSGFSWFNKLTIDNSIRTAIIQKLSIVQQRLELIQNEYNRLQYYVVYKNEQIELHPELAESFFNYTADEIKSSINYQ